MSIINNTNTGLSQPFNVNHLSTIGVNYNFQQKYFVHWEEFLKLKIPII